MSRETEENKTLFSVPRVGYLFLQNEIGENKVVTVLSSFLLFENNLKRFEMKSV